MSFDDRPFACNNPGCTQTFSTHDRLSVHMEMHEKRLPLSLELPARNSDALSLVDQTPTPSRFLGNFLKNFEESGLGTTELGEISPLVKTTTTTTTTSDAGNPFAETFKRASNSSSPKSNLKLTVPTTIVPSTQDSLHTPSIDDAVVDGSRKNGFIVPTALNIPLEASHDKEARHGHGHGLDSAGDKRSKHGVVVTAPTGSGPSPLMNAKSFPVSVICSNMQTLHYGIAKGISSVPLPSVKNTIPKAVISPPPLSQSSPPIKKSVPVLPKAPNTSTISMPTVQPTFSQVLLALPNGTAVKIPVLQTPLTSAVLTAHPEQIIVNPVLKPKEESEPVRNITPDLVKIKSDLNSSLQSKRPEIVVPRMSATTAQSPTSIAAAIVTAPRISSIPASSASVISAQGESGADDPNLPESALFIRGKPGRKSKNAPREDPQAKKMRSLERNRAAAMRCRKKRKQWIEELETNAHKMEKMNEKLQAEVTMLRKEVTSLKTALLFHKDCPVTLQQMKAASNNKEKEGSDSGESQ